MTTIADKIKNSLTPVSDLAAETQKLRDKLNAMSGDMWLIKQKLAALSKESPK